MSHLHICDNVNIVNTRTPCHITLSHIEVYQSLDAEPRKSLASVFEELGLSVVAIIAISVIGSYSEFFMISI